MENIQLTRDQFDSIEILNPKSIARVGLVIKKISDGEWYRLEYKSVTKVPYLKPTIKSVEKNIEISELHVNPDKVKAMKEEKDTPEIPVYIESKRVEVQTKDEFLLEETYRDDWDIEVKKIQII